MKSAVTNVDTRVAEGEKKWIGSVDTQSEFAKYIGERERARTVQTTHDIHRRRFQDPGNASIKDSKMT